MPRTTMTGTVHRATVTQADLLLHVVDVTDGARLATILDPAETGGDDRLVRGDASAH